MADLQNITHNNEQILNDIQSLQQIEQRLFNNLETNTTLTPQQQQDIVDKMNKLTDMRVNLYKSLRGMNSFYNTALNSSIGTLEEQSFAIGIVENELNRAKKRLELLKNEKNNKIRLVEINDYYGDKYAEHSQLMKIIIYTLVPIIILAALNNKGILPGFIYYILIAIISIIGAFLFWRRYASLIMRDNMNYQEYNFPFNIKALPTGKSTASASDPWLSLTGYGTCVGEACCSVGQIYDSSSNICVNSNVNSNINGSTESFVTESMVNDILTKTQSGKYKDDVNIGTIIYPQTESFINR